MIADVVIIVTRQCMEFIEKPIFDINFYPLLKPNANPAAKPPVKGTPEFDIALII